MSVHTDPSGHRRVQADMEVPSTPDEVWRAIATRPGISSWFAPSHFEERVGGAATSSVGPGAAAGSAAAQRTRQAGAVR